MSTKSPSLTVRVIAIGAGFTVAGLLAWFMWARGEDSFAKGILFGAGAVVIAAIILWARGIKGGTAAHLASGEGDERERAIMTAAAADGAFTMLAAGVIAMVGAVFGWPAVAVAGIILWAGIIGIVVSFVIRNSRS